MPSLQYPILVVFEDEIDYILSEETLAFTVDTIQDKSLINQQIIDSDFNIFTIKTIQNTKKLPQGFWKDFTNPLYKVDLDVYFYKKTTIEAVRQIANDYIEDFLGTGEIGKSVCHSFMQELNEATEVREIIQIMFDETV